MYVKITAKLSKGFGTWKEMVMGSQELTAQHGMTFVFAGTEQGNDEDLMVIIKFESAEGLQGFIADEELKQRRADAGAVLETAIVTPMNPDSFAM